MFGVNKARSRSLLEVCRRRGEVVERVPRGANRNNLKVNTGEGRGRGGSEAFATTKGSRGTAR